MFLLLLSNCRRKKKRNLGKKLFLNKNLQCLSVLLVFRKKSKSRKKYAHFSLSLSFPLQNLESYLSLSHSFFLQLCYLVFHSKAPHLKCSLYLTRSSAFSSFHLFSILCSPPSPPFICLVEFSLFHVLRSTSFSQKRYKPLLPLCRATHGQSLEFKFFVCAKKPFCFQHFENEL